MECSKALRKLRLITDDLTLNGPQPANYQTRAGPAGSVCALGTPFLLSVRSRGFLKCKSSYNYVLTFKVQVGWITLLEKKKLTYGKIILPDISVHSTVVQHQTSTQGMVLIKNILLISKVIIITLRYYSQDFQKWKMYNM